MEIKENKERKRNCCVAFWVNDGKHTGSLCLSQIERTQGFKPRKWVIQHDQENGYFDTYLILFYGAL